MRILVFTSVPTHPLNAGNRARILSICDCLRQAGHDVVVCCSPREEGDLEAMARHFPEGFESLEFVDGYRATSILARIKRRIQRKLGDARGHMMGLDDWHDDRVSTWLLSLHAKRRFDAILVNYVFHSAILEAFPTDVLKVLECHDSFGNRHLRYLEAGMAPEWYSTSEADEHKGLNRADVVVAIEAREAAKFRQGLSASSKVVSVHPFMGEIAPARRSTSPKAVIVASGNTVNVKGVAWFLEKVAPLVKARLPDFELVLAGNVGNGFQGVPGVRCLGRVDDLREAYESAAIALNPIRMGTGFCIKTLESLAFGMPLVSTRTGIRGIESLEGTDCFAQVEDDDHEAMAQVVISLLNDPAKAAAMAHNAWTQANRWSTSQRSTLLEIFNAPR